MNYSTNNQLLTIVLPERIDTASAVETGKGLTDICHKNPHKEIVLDASGMTYISSSGLRILLTLVKEEKELRIVNTNPEVYSVFEMTGFTRLMKVEKALRHISVEGCREIGRGGVGIVYQLTDDSIIKVFREGTDRADVDKEISMAKEAFVLGMPTAISFDVVLVGTQYGLIYEMLNAKTLSSVINEHPEKLEDYALQFAHLYRQMHDIHVPAGSVIPEAFANEMESLQRISKYFSPEIIDKARELFLTLPKGDSLLHCDLHPKNVMVQDGQLMLIDMGEVCYGNPLIDLGHTCSTMMHLVGDYKLIMNLTEEQAKRFYQVMIDEYFSDKTKEEKAAALALIENMSIVRGISWLSLSDNFPQELIDQARENFCRRTN